MDPNRMNIPIGFGRMNKVIGIREAVYTLAGGYTGSGKTTFIDDAFVLNPYEFWLKNKGKVKLRVIYWSMERRKDYKIAKWISRKMFLDHGMVVDIATIMGDFGKKLTPEQYKIFKKYKDYIDGMFDSGFITMIEGPDNPTGIFKLIENFAEGKDGYPAMGKIVPVDKFNKNFERSPGYEDEVVLLVIDHIGLLKMEKGSNKKEAIDKLSEYMRKARDLYGFSPVLISQFNRDIANPMRIKNGDVEPMLEDFKDTGNTQEDADVVVSLFDPMRYKVSDPIGYNLAKLRDPVNGNKKYRCLKILKNSYGVDDVRFGLAFQPEVGMFKEMPKVSEIVEQEYDAIIDNSYFL